MSKVKLLGCPFCGEELEVHCTGRYYMHKLNGCIFQHYCFETDDVESIEKWNTRKPMQNIVKWLEEKVQEWYRERVSCMRILNYESARQAMNMMGAYREVIEIVKEEGGLNET